MVWQDQALCAGQNPDLWFQDGNGPDKYRNTQLARALCAGCPVTAECLTHAMEQPELWGVWGGTTPQARRALGMRGTVGPRRVVLPKGPSPMARDTTNRKRVGGRFA